ncbi:AMP-binding protein [Kiloniella sp.]|uniref:AMP-binding protein n=1 Tax=Kiloniella sp. TaxID=1938587 RepID=UPI003A921B18
MKCLKASFQKNAHKIALVDTIDGSCATYNDILSCRTKIIKYFGKNKNNLIFYQPQNTLISAKFILALLSTDNTLCLVPPKIGNDILNDYIDNFSPDFIFSNKENTPSAGSYTHCEHEIIPNTELYIPKTSSPLPIDKNIRLLLTTSGSTGSSKFVQLTEENISSNVSSVERSMMITDRDIPYCHLPFHYSYGLSVLISHARAGAKLVVTSSTLMEKPFWKDIDRYQCTFFPAVPFHIETILKFGLERLRIPSVRKFSVAGGALDKEKQATFLKQLTRDSDFFVMYGQTEASPRITSFNLKHYPEKIGSVGKPLNNTEILITPTEHEIILTGPSVMRGYAADRKSLSPDQEPITKLSTGDLGYIDKDEFLYITGRKKRIAKIYGHRISLEDIEQKLSLCSPCILLEGNNLLHAFYHEDDKEDELDKLFKNNYNFPGKQIQFHLISEFPRQESGKVDFQKLHKLL